MFSTFRLIIPLVFTKIYNELSCEYKEKQKRAVRTWEQKLEPEDVLVQQLKMFGNNILI